MKKILIAVTALVFTVATVIVIIDKKYKKAISRISK